MNFFMKWHKNEIVSRKVFVYRDGKFVEVYNSEPENKSAYVHGDEIPPLRHPTTGEIFTSASKMQRRTQELGMVTVGNELQSSKPTVLQDKITEALVMDRIEKAESILNDSSKFRVVQERNKERLYKMERLLNGSK